jgi:hypothetical protein
VIDVVAIFRLALGCGDDLQRRLFSPLLVCLNPVFGNDLIVDDDVCPDDANAIAGQTDDALDVVGQYRRVVRTLIAIGIRI